MLPGLRSIGILGEIEKSILPRGKMLYVSLPFLKGRLPFLKGHTLIPKAKIRLSFGLPKVSLGFWGRFPVRSGMTWGRFRVKPGMRKGPCLSGARLGLRNGPETFPGTCWSTGGGTIMGGDVPRGVLEGVRPFDGLRDRPGKR